MVNYLAILVVALFGQVLGALWYGKFFTQPWVTLMRWDKKKVKEMQKKPCMHAHITSFAGMLLMGVTLAYVLSWANVTSALQAALYSAWLWLGLGGLSALAQSMYEDFSPKLFLINGGYKLVTMVVMGILLTLWV